MASHLNGMLRIHREYSRIADALCRRYNPHPASWVDRCRKPTVTLQEQSWTANASKT